MQTIDPLLYSQTPVRDPNAAPKQNLGKDDFLNLMMVQLRNQDPLNVMQDQQFIAQMAQFSTLEQTTNLNLAMENLTGFSQLSQGANLIGKEVEAVLPAQGDQTENTITGQVEEVRLQDGKIKLLVNGQDIDFSQITHIRDTQGGQS